MEMELGIRNRLWNWNWPAGRSARMGLVSGLGRRSQAQWPHTLHPLDTATSWSLERLEDGTWERLCHKMLILSVGSRHRSFDLPTEKTDRPLVEPKNTHKSIETN